MNLSRISIDSLNCVSAISGIEKATFYILTPMEPNTRWMTRKAEELGINLIAISGMDWDNDMTPWPAPGQPPGEAPFEGKAADFLKRLTDTVVPTLERAYKLINPPCGRTLIGISLSGLFTLWQWTQTDFFQNVGSLSGSFWYEGFAEWFAKQPIRKTGKAYFLLGRQECHSPVAAFRPVQRCTESVMAHLRAQGVNARFDLVPGNHYQHTIERLDLTLQSLLAK